MFEYNTACDNYTACGKLGGFGGAVFCTCIIQARTFSLKNNTARGSGDIIDSNCTCICSISNGTFHGNTARIYGGVIYSRNTKLTAKASSFHSNSVLHLIFGGGGAIFTFSSSSRGSISECSFSNNKAILNGGALSHLGNGILIKTSNFWNNTVLSKLGQGGAISTACNVLSGALTCLDNERIVKISDCFFDGNQASFRGGAIMATQNLLLIANSSFPSPSYPCKESYIGGTVLYSKSAVLLEHVLFLDIHSYDSQNSLIVHQNSQIMTGEKGHPMLTTFILTLKKGVHIKCLNGKSIMVSNKTANTLHSFFFLSVSCSFCSQNSYTLQSGHLDLFSENNSIIETNAECYHCPFGGVCEKGAILSANNFWGFKSENEVRFASCPFSYCCFKRECVNYSSCHTLRTGILCSQCEKRFH